MIDTLYYLILGEFARDIVHCCLERLTIELIGAVHLTANPISFHRHAYQ